MKKFFVAIIVFFLINNTMVHAENKAYTIFYDDEMVKVEDGEDFILFNNHLLVSPTQITRVLPFSVPGKGIWWDDDTKTITFAYFDEDDYMRARASIKVGEPYFTEFNQRFELKQTAVIRNGRVYLPLRGISEVYGKEVIWSKTNDNYYIHINSK